MPEIFSDLAHGTKQSKNRVTLLAPVHCILGVTGSVDLGKYLEIVSARRIAEQVQVPISAYFTLDNKND